VDTNGDVFIADTDNNVIREVNHATGIITTYAGNGTYGSSGDGGPATAAELSGPGGVAVDGSGNIYIADTDNSVIREVIQATGNITTYAGNGTGGYTGDGGPATAAELNYPDGVAVDGSGNIYIADTDNSVIREVNHTTENITTYAGNGTGGYAGDGGPATAAELQFAQGIAVDGSGNIYIADTYNNVVRKVTAATGLINTVAGGDAFGSSGNGGPATSAELGDPYGVAVDSNNNIYIADTGSNAIRKVNASTGTITTVAGGAQPVYNTLNPAEMARDAAGDIFFADPGGNVVREFNHSTNEISIVAGTGTAGYTGNGGAATSAELNSPSGVAFFGPSTLFIADSTNNVIRAVNLSTGIITAFAGNGTAGYTGDNGQATAAELKYPNQVAVDANGDVFIADTSNNVIREVNHATGIITTYAGNGTSGSSGNGGLATAAELNYPDGVAVDGSGNVYIADTGNNVIREVDHATGNITTYAGNGTSGYTGDNGLATAAELSSPNGVAVDGSGNIYIADSGNSAIREVNHTTEDITTVAGNGSYGDSGDGGLATAAELSYPRGVAVDGSGNIYIADTGNGVIREVNHTTGDITTIAGADGGLVYSPYSGPATGVVLANPDGVVVDSHGDIFISDEYFNVVREVNAATGNITTIAGNGNYGYTGDSGQATSAELADPAGLALDGRGNLFIADMDNNVIREVNLATGIITTVAGNGTYGYTGNGGKATAAELASPSGVAVDSQGDIFIADQYNNAIREVSGASGDITTIAGNGTYGDGGDGGLATSAELADPSGVALDNSGDLLIADTDNEAIRQLNLGTGIITLVAGTESEGNSGYSGDGGQATLAQLGSPSSLAVDSSGNIYIADTDNNVIREVSTPAGGAETVTVSKATLTVTANNLSKVYGAANPTLTYTMNGFVNGDSSSVVSGAPALSTSASTGSGVGGYPITVSAGTLAAANYTFTLENGTLSVTPAALAVTANNLSKVYGTANPTLTYTMNGFVNGDGSSVVSGAPALSTTASTGSGVGGYPITISAGTLAAANYTFTLETGTLSVTTAALTVTAQPQSRFAGQSNPPLTVTYSGFVNGDTAQTLVSPPNVTTTATPTSPPGVYPISVGGAASPNYAISYVNSTLTVKPVTVQGISIGKIPTGKKKTAQVIVLHFSGPLSAATAQSTSNYIVGTVPKGKKKSKLDALSTATYSASALTVTLLTRSKLVLSPPLQVTINFPGLGVSESNVVAKVP